jgi:hypothetical protein
MISAAHIRRASEKMMLRHVGIVSFHEGALPTRMS